MTVSRRTFFAGAAGAGLAVAASPVRVAFAQDGGAPSGQAPAFHRLDLGETTVTALSDGHFGLGAQAFPTVSEEAFASSLRDGFFPESAPYQAPVNAYLVERGDRVVLIDAGASTDMAPTVGQLSQSLAGAGVEPASVDTILITHLHPDHFGGMVAEDGTKRFGNAEVLVRAEEAAFWTDPATRASVPEPVRPMVDAVVQLLALYEGAVTPFSADGEVAPGIEAVFMPGHTPGHTGFVVADGDDALLIWGDLIHAAPIQMAHPERFIVFDTVPEAAVATRASTLDRAASDRLMVAGMHMPFPGVGHVAREGEGYRFEVLPWQYR